MHWWICLSRWSCIFAKLLGIEISNDGEVPVMEVFDNFLEIIEKIISLGVFFLGRCFSHVGRMNINAREFTLFLYHSEDFDSSGCWSRFDFVVFGYCQCSNSFVHQVCTCDFQGFVDRKSHSQLFVSFSSLEYTVVGAVSIFLYWVCFWFLNLQMSTCFLVKATSMSLSSGITPRTFQDPMLNTREKTLVRDLGI